jgi:hypothetical protein
MKYISNCLTKKGYAKPEFVPREHVSNEFLIYEFDFVGHPNFLAFCKYGKRPINIVPAGIVNIERS